MAPGNTEEQPYTMWCFGLSEADMDCIRQCAGAECVVTARSIDALRDEQLLLRDDPTLLWLHMDAWSEADAGSLKGLAASIPKVLVMGARSAEDLDVFIDADAEHVLRAPLTRAGVYRILRRTLEVCSIYQDMGRMAREILLHRESLGRKDEILQLLFGAEELFARAATIPDILAALRSGLTPLLDPRQMHTVLWRPHRGRLGAAVYYDGVAPDGRHAEAWREILLDAIRRVSGSPQKIRSEERLLAGRDLGPRNGHLLLLPLRHGGEALGAVMFLLPRDIAFSRDQNLALNVILSRAAGLVQLARATGVGQNTPAPVKAANAGPSDSARGNLRPQVQASLPQEPSRQAPERATDC